jgi:type I restriction enzyme R subunit
MMKRFNNSEEEYNRTLIEAFKGSGDPEILIVVSKLLTGFDAPRNTVLYLCKPLRDHTLLQAVARVNRLFEEEDQEKEFGFVLDYEGLLGELDKALTTYTAFEGYDDKDIQGALVDVREEIRKLPQLHEQLWDLFKEVKNKRDMEQFEQFLADEAKRHEFYERLRAFSRCLHISLSSDKVHEVFPDKKIETFKRDWKQFTELRRSVQVRYQEIVDIKEFEPKVQKLLDDHVIALPAETIIKPININDRAALKAVIEETGVTTASKADRIASATRRTITESMEEDPAFYKQFSEMLEETIRGYRERRLSEQEYLSNVIDIASRVATKNHGRDLPPPIAGNDDGAAFFGILEPVIPEADRTAARREEAAQIALAVLDIVKAHHIVDVWSNEVAMNNMRNAIDDYFFDVVRDRKGIEIAVDQLDELETRIMNLARARFPG